MRRTVARRLVESMRSIPHVYLTTSVDAEELLGFRAELNRQLHAGGEGLKVSVNDLVVKACAVLLAANPELNVSWAGDSCWRTSGCTWGSRWRSTAGSSCRWSVTPTEDPHPGRPGGRS